MENQTFEQTPKKTNPWLIVGSIFVTALLIGAAFTAGRLLKKPVAANEGDVMVMGDGDRVMMQKSFQMDHPEELPDGPPDVSGMMQKVENNSIFVGASSGPVGIIIRKEGSQVDMDTQGDPGSTTTVEVVVTKETRLYKDVTAFQIVQGNASPDQIEQKIVPATLDELDGQAIITAWGERKGDRLIADVVLCTIIPKLSE